MLIATLNAVDPERLAAVIVEMESLGAPTIRAVWMDIYGHWAALEGSHRTVAASQLGLTPIIQEVEYRDDLTLTDLGCDWHGDELTIAQIADESYWMGEIVEFPTTNLTDKNT
jgi:hypothetical protein